MMIGSLRRPSEMSSPLKSTVSEWTKSSQTIAQLVTSGNNYAVWKAIPKAKRTKAQ